MKILAQSTVIKQTPYVHLGYLATTTIQPGPPHLAGGALVTILGILMAFSVVFGKNDRKQTTIRFMKRHSRRLFWAGLCVILAGGLMIGVSLAKSRVVYSHPVSMTQIRQLSILHEIEELRLESKEAPLEINELFLPETDSESSKDISQDGWRRPMRLLRTESDQGSAYQVLSAGKDGEFGTSDDIGITLRPDGSQVSLDGRIQCGPRPVSPPETRE